MTSNPFDYTTGPQDADIVIVGEAWGNEEHNQQLPFKGASGFELNKLLKETGLDRNDILCTNLVDKQPQGNDLWREFYPTQAAKKEARENVRGLYPMGSIQMGLEKLRSVVMAYPRKLVIGLGNYSLWALTEDCFSVKDHEKRKVPRGIGSWRGSQLYTRPDMGEFPFLPTYHPAAALRNWPWRYVIAHDLGVRVPRAINDNWDEPEYKFIIRPHFQETVQTLKWLISRGDSYTLAVDIETRDNIIACMGLGWSTTEAICIPFLSTEDPTGFYTYEETAEIFHLLRLLFSQSNIRIVGQNFLFDMQYISEYIWAVPQVHMDTMIAHHVCWPGTPKGLDYLSSLYCNHHRYWKDEGKHWNPRLPQEQLWRYNCLDCVKTFEISMELEELIEKLNLVEQNAFQHSMIPTVFRMMEKGVKIDLKQRNEVNIDLISVSTKISKKLEYLLPEHIYPRKPKASAWYNSPIQLAHVMYDILGQQVVYDRKTRSRTTNEEALQKIMHRQPLLTPVCQGITELRSLSRFKDAVNSKLDYDSRMRCSYNLTGTETYRFSSSKNVWGGGANLQTISKGHEE